MSETIHCPFRDAIENHGGHESARCALLQQILGVDDAALCRVGNDACLACCQTFRPSIGTINSVVASFLFTASDKILKAGGVPGCDAEKARNLHKWAKASVECHIPNEERSAAKPRSWRLCCHLGRQIGFQMQATASGRTRIPVYECSHPAHEHTTPTQCDHCRDWTADADVTVPDLSSLLSSSFDKQPAVREWAVGVTTSPRIQPTLGLCLDTLRRAGWEQPRLFVDGAIDHSATTASAPVTLRTPPVGAWPNYYLSLIELLHRHPHADAVMLVQDDAVFYDRVDLRASLEKLLWFSDPPGIISLYCSKAYARPDSGWYQNDEEWNWGAVAFVFPRQRALEFVSDPLVLEHRWSPRGTRYIDEVIGRWAARCNVPIYFPSPSLVQHVGETSTLWPGVPAAGYRRADHFAGDV